VKEFHLFNNTGGSDSNEGEGVEHLLDVNNPISLSLITWS
jgi:hypothetical protein